MEQAILELGALDLDMLGQLELALESAPGDALMQIGGLGRIFALAGDGQHAIGDFDAEILFRKAGGGDGDAIIILVAALDIVGRVAALRGVGILEQVEKTVEADSGTIERRIIQTHGTTS